MKAHPAAHASKLASVHFAVDNHPAAWSGWPTTDGPLVAAEPYSTWVCEIGRLATLVAFWSSPLEPARARLALLQPFDRSPRLADVWSSSARQLERAPTADETQLARQFVATVVDLEIRGGIEIRLGSGADGLRLRPKTLASAAYLSFAREIAAAQGTPACQVCGQAMLDAERSSRRYCSLRCKTRAQRARRSA